MYVRAKDASDGTSFIFTFNVVGYDSVEQELWFDSDGFTVYYPCKPVDVIGILGFLYDYGHVDISVSFARLEWDDDINFSELKE